MHVIDGEKRGGDRGGEGREGREGSIEFFWSILGGRERLRGPGRSGE